MDSYDSFFEGLETAYDDLRRKTGTRTEWPHSRRDLSPDGRYAFVPNRESNDVSVIDTEHVRDGERRPWEIARIPVGIWPGGTVFAPEGDRAFVANNKTNDVSVIDVDAFEEVDRFDAELHPDGIAYLSR